MYFQFKSIIIAAGLEERFKSVVPATLFVFNDTTYGALPASRVGNLYEDTERGPRNYVQSFTCEYCSIMNFFSSFNGLVDSVPLSIAVHAISDRQNRRK